MNKKEKLIEYLGENIETLKDLVQELNSWDGSFEELSYWENDEDFFNTFFYNKPMEVARAINYGDYNYMDEYVQINVYGNIESKNSYEVDEEIESYTEEILDRWLEEYENNNVDCYDKEFLNLLADADDEEQENGNNEEQ